MSTNQSFKKYFSLKLLILLLFFLSIVILIVKAVTPNPVGISRFYDDQPYHFNVLRAFGHIPSNGGDTGEILTTIKKIPEGNEEMWYTQWDQTGARIEKLARSYKDPVSRGLGLLRAHNYYRTAEFFLDPGDPRRIESFRKNVAVFYEGLNDLKVKHTVIDVPYGNKKLKAVYFPAKNESIDKPLIVFCGGYDSTLEELYFSLVQAATKRNYSILIYEGPGQGSIIREQNLQFTHEWERPTAAVLDQYLKQFNDKRKIVLIGMSMGGFLAPRAAAFDKRIDGVVAFNQFFDYKDIVKYNAPSITGFLYDNGFHSLLNTILKFKMKTSPNIRWGIRNAQWTMGVKEPVTFFEISSKYSLKDISKKITCDVLILAGEKDHFMPLSHAYDFKNALTNARSVAMRVFTEKEGGHEHCQLGASHLWHAELFEWLEKTY